jgi:ribosomal protein S18 acetylase RimI-like enzyme
MTADLAFEDDVRRRIYDYVERNGAAEPEEVRGAVRVDADSGGSKPARSGAAASVRLSPTEFEHHVAALTEAGHLHEEDGTLRVAVEADTETFELDDGTPVAVRLAREDDSDGVRAVMGTVAGEGTSIVAESVAEALDDEPVLRRTDRRSRVFFVATLGKRGAEGGDERGEEPDEERDEDGGEPVTDGDVVGWVHLHAPELEKLRHTAELTVGVLPDHREQGIGSRLLARGLQWADAQGYRKVYQSVPATNETAVDFLTDRDWTVEATREDHYLVEGEYVEEVMLATWVDEAA